MRLAGFLILVAVASPYMALAPAAHADEEEVAPEEILGKPKLDMAPFNFSVIKRGVVEGQATLHFVLIMDNTTDFEYVRTRLPQVRADFNAALTMLSRQHFNVNRPIDPDVVKAYLTPYLDHRLGKDMAQVFIKQALIKPH